MRDHLIRNLLAKMQFRTIYLPISYLNFKMKIYEIVMLLAVKIVCRLHENMKTEGVWGAGECVCVGAGH